MKNTLIFTCSTNIPVRLLPVIMNTSYPKKSENVRTHSGKPLFTGSALGGDKFRNICDMKTIPLETDVLVNAAHFPSFTSPKFPFRTS